MKTLKDLLDLPFIFTQHGLLSTSEFEKECERRGLSLLSLGNGEFEPLHHNGVLVPVYRVEKDIPAIRAAAKLQGHSVSLALGHSVSRIYTDLREDRDAGLLHDPRSEPFQPWSTYQHKIDDYPVRMSEFVYSPYQLLLLPSLREVASHIRVRRTGPHQFSYDLELTEEQRTSAHTTATANDDLVLALSALDRVYRWRITGRVSHYEGWDEFEDAFDPVTMLEWLGWNAERVLETAEHLLSKASHIDPLDDWIDLVRLCRPEKREQLKGDALIAMDHRIAAEILLLFYEDLVKLGVASPLPTTPRYAWHPLCDRLHAKREELDETLMDFGLSPHPSLVLFLEGETEMLIVPRAMKLLGIPLQRDFIELHIANLNSNIDQQVAYVAPPSLGEPHKDYVPFTRPPTHFLVVRDAEGHFQDPESAETYRQTWIKKIAETIRTKFGIQILPDEIRWLVEVETWGEENIEFAHFTNYEIALAIDKACRRLGNTPIRMLREDEVELCRRSTHSQNIENLWKHGPFDRKAKRKLKKLEVWEELWEILEQKIKAAIEHRNIETIPIGRVLLHAYNMAISVHRHSVVVNHVKPGSEEVKQA